MKIKEVQIKVCFWRDTTYGNTYCSGVGHVWGVDGVKNTIRLPFAYGSEPKRKVLDLLAKESLIPTGSQSELDALGWAVEVVDYGKGLKRDCVSFGKDGL